jgi:ornithine cyclodeaminase/alanine dehydrogenase-like protein (mu-crystallin family)
MGGRETPEGLLYLTSQEVRSICKEIDSIALMREVFHLHGSSDTVLPEEAYLTWKTMRNESVRSLNMPAYVGGKFRAAGTKIINSNPKNRSRGLPRANGLTLLFDEESVRVICVMDGGYISALRTASVSMLCVSLLSVRSIHCLAVVGVGVIGRSHIDLAVKTFPSLERVIVFDDDAAAAERLSQDLEATVIREVAIEVRNAKEAVSLADVVIPATTTTTGYIPYEWLKPGSVVINVSLDDLLPDVFLKSDLLFVDDWNLVRSDCRRMLGRLYREGLVAGPDKTVTQNGIRKIDGEISDLVLGRHPGRRSLEEIVIVNPFGLAVEDIALASRIFEIASRHGIGVRLPT